VKDNLVIKKNAEKYDRIYKKGHDHKYPNLDLVRLERMFFKTGKGSLLDYGFGCGENLIHLLKTGYNVIGAEASKEAIQLVEKKLQLSSNIGKKINLFFIDSDTYRLPFEDKTFDFIICTSVLSLLESKDRISVLLNEFDRILNIDGRIIIDINGPDSDFASKGKFIDEDTFEYNLSENGEQLLKVYCPRTNKIFAKLLNQFEIIELGNTTFNYFNMNNSEFIACLKKKN